MPATSSTPWFTATTPVLNQLGATIGHGVTPTYQGVNYTDLLTNMQEQQQREADRDYGLRKQQLDQQYKTARMQAKSQQERNEIDRWYNEQQVEIARARLAEEGRQFDTKTGMDLLSTLAQLRGPADYYQAANYARGVANDPNSAAFLTALRNNTKLPGFGAQQGIPEAETGNTLMAKLGGTYQAGTGGTVNASGQSAATGVSQDSRLGQIGSLYQQGVHKLTAGSLEQLTPTEMGLLKSGIDASGGDYDTFLAQYRNSRIGQSLNGNYRAA